MEKMGSATINEYIEEKSLVWHYRYASVAFFQSNFKAGINRIINLREGGKNKN